MRLDSTAHLGVVRSHLGRAGRRVSHVLVPDVAIDGTAVGGEGVGRLPDGRVVFVHGTVIGDVADIELVEERDRWTRGRVARVVSSGAARTTPSCAAVELGCGGCDWQHVAKSSRAERHLSMVGEQLRRFVGSDVEPRHGGSVPALGYRTTVRLAVDGNGHAGFRRHQSHDVVHHGDCEVADELLQPVLRAGWTGATELVARASRSDGKVFVVVSPGLDALDQPPELGEHARLVGRDDLDAGRRAWIFDEAAGRRWRLSADSFFQSGPDAVELLVGSIAHQLEPLLDGATTAADLYGGVGVLAGGLAGRDGFDALRWTLVESSPSSIADAKVNLADLDVTIRRSSVERWRPTRQHLLVADPPRAGVGKHGIQAIAATRARALVLVSCDLAAFGRDAARLTADGWELGAVEALDLFPGTSHVEVVSTYRHRTFGHGQ